MRQQRPFHFLVVFIIFFQGEIFSQSGTSHLTDFQPLPMIGFTVQAPQNGYVKLPVFTPELPEYFFKKNDNGQAKPLILSPHYYASRLGFFCKNELKMDRVTPLPLRLRIGSLDQVNWLEQKPNALKPGR